MINKHDFLENFIIMRGNVKKTSCNLYVVKKSNKMNIDIYSLINYWTEIAYFDIKGQLHLNVKKYSRTTSKNQGLLRYYADKYNVKIIEYEGKEI